MKPRTPSQGLGERPHIALVIGALHGVSGGAERVLVDVANGLHRRGYPVTVLTYQERNGPSFYPLDYGISHLDGRQRHSRRRGRTSFGPLTRASQRSRIAAIGTWVLQYGQKTFQLRRLLRIARPDVVISFLPSSFTYLEIAAIGMKTKTIASMHNVPERDLGGDPERWDQNPVDIALRRRALRTSDANTVLLPSFLDQIPKSVRGKTRVIPNLIHRYDGPLADVSEDSRENTILAVGRFSPAKDHATLIRAWSQIENENPTWCLRIIGTGPLRRKLSRLIEELDLERVVLDDPTTEIEGAYVAAKFVVMSSIYEGFGLVTVEAMACGLPVIGFADCEGTNEIVVHEKNGLLVEPGDDRATALADSMRRLIVSESDRIALATRAPETVEAFEPGPVIDSWEQLIHDVGVDGGRA